jgi:hypothetical protein
MGAPQVGQADGCSVRCSDGFGVPDALPSSGLIESSGVFSEPPDEPVPPRPTVAAFELSVAPARAGLIPADPLDVPGPIRRRSHTAQGGMVLGVVEAEYIMGAETEHRRDAPVGDTVDGHVATVARHDEAILRRVTVHLHGVRLRGSPGPTPESPP